MMESASCESVERSTPRYIRYIGEHAAIPDAALTPKNRFGTVKLFTSNIIRHFIGEES